MQPEPTPATGPAEAAAARVVGDHDYWRNRNRYYYDQLARVFRRHVPPGARVLDVGCRTGELLAALQPAVGVGVDEDAALTAAARRRHPEFTFYGSLDAIPAGETFDYVTLCNTVGQLHDVQAVFTTLRRFCRSDTRVIVAYQNALWEPALGFGTRIGWRRRIEGLNWLSRADLANLFHLADYDVVRELSELLIPVNVPLLAPFANRFLVRFWPFRHLALGILLVARPILPPFERPPTVSVVVPTRNERGNILAAVSRTPEMGAGTELIFVDGWSTDGTQEEIRRCIGLHPQRRIRFIEQQGARGKGQAVRQGFDTAEGQVLMILDADLTVAPEDLPKFLQALTASKGELINGTRLVYPMQQQAMRFLNKLGNRFFSILFTWLLGQPFRDTLCGTKVLTRGSYEKIKSTRAEIGLLDPFGDFDLLFGAARNDLRIIEIPVRYGARTYGETNISRFRDGWLLLRMSWKAFWKLKIR